MNTTMDEKSSHELQKKKKNKMKKRKENMHIFQKESKTNYISFKGNQNNVQLKSTTHLKGTKKMI